MLLTHQRSAMHWGRGRSQPLPIFGAASVGTSCRFRFRDGWRSPCRTGWGFPLAASQVHVFSEGSAGRICRTQQGCLQVRRGTPCGCGSRFAASAQRLLPLSEQGPPAGRRQLRWVCTGRSGGGDADWGRPTPGLAHIRGLGFAREPSRIDKRNPAARRWNACCLANRAGGSRAFAPRPRLSPLGCGRRAFFKEQSLLVTRLCASAGSFPCGFPLSRSVTQVPLRGSAA